MAQAKKCSPTCRSFKCVKNAALYQRHAVYCRMTEEKCKIENCTYAMCYKRRLLPNGVCGETVKRKTTERNPEDIPDRTVKLRGKALRRIKYDDDFF